MGTFESVLLGYAVGSVITIIVLIFVMFFRKGNLWEQGFHDGWTARGDSIAEKPEEPREENKL